MKQYTLTEKDIRVLICAAGKAICENNVFSDEWDSLIMCISTSIEMKIIDHLSGRNKFPDETIRVLKEFFGIAGERNQNTDFKKWFERIKSSVDEYKSVAERTSIIEGYFSQMPDNTTFTAYQIGILLRLRYL